MKERESKVGTPEGIADTFRKSTSEMLMLGLLQERPMYVYEMIQELDKRSESTYKINSLYFAVTRLQKYNYIQDYEIVVSEDTKTRRYYMITDEGVEYYKKLCKQYDELLESVRKIQSSFQTHDKSDFKAESNDGKQ